jgi:16S rRNA (cytosine1402-N4)-methyltransferase
MQYRHIPVLLAEVIESLKVKTGDYIIDCTLGGGGYTLALAKLVGESGRVLSTDLDSLAIEHVAEKIKNNKVNNVILAQSNFKYISAVVDEKMPNQKFNGIVLDLGLSSAQLDDEKRGFSFLKDTPLNMAFGEVEDYKHSTAYIVNKYPAGELIRIIREYGEEYNASRIVRAITMFRRHKKIETTGELVKIIHGVVPKTFKTKIDPATKTFQALRLATNRELENLEAVLPQALDLLAPGGRLAVVTFHSLEDRIVKHFFQRENRDCICPPEIPLCQCQHQKRIEVVELFGKKFLEVSEAEKENNPRARSAKLRVAEKI